MLGPNPSVAQRLLGARAAQAVAEWKAWRAEHGERYDAGEPVPEPPYAEQLDSFARQTT